MNMMYRDPKFLWTGLDGIILRAATMQFESKLAGSGLAQACLPELEITPPAAVRLHCKKKPTAASLWPGLRSKFRAA